MHDTSKEHGKARPPADAADLGAIEVEDLDGHHVRLADLWAERPGVLVFLRHYG